ncbi:MAG: holin family protein [Deltaproteobacteria bacterium]|nr:holin family protein [Deltaproteobacteria bacterium]
MSPLETIAGLFKPAADLIINLFPNEVEQKKAQAELDKIQAQVSAEIIQLQGQVAQAQAAINLADAQGGNWLQRSWRPVSMWIFLGLVTLDSFGVLPNRLAPDAWTLLQIGFGGYTIGRSLEKITPSVTGAIKGRE